MSLRRPDSLGGDLSFYPPLLLLLLTTLQARLVHAARELLLAAVRALLQTAASACRVRFSCFRLLLHLQLQCLCLLLLLVQCIFTLLLFVLAVVMLSLASPGRRLR